MSSILSLLPYQTSVKQQMASEGQHIAPTTINEERPSLSKSDSAVIGNMDTASNKTFMYI